MHGNEYNHVQIELTEAEYEAFREFANERGLTVKKAAQAVLVDWIDRQRRADPNDRAYPALDEHEDESLPASATTDARTEADLVDRWSGDDVEFTLADDPPVHQ